MAEGRGFLTPPEALDALQSLGFNLLALGQPDIHDAFANNPFLDTRGLPTPATGARATYILERPAELSRPFGTRIAVHGDTAQIMLPARQGAP